MKKGLLLAFACLTIACQAQSEYQLQWSDEFEGTELNRDYWNVEDNARGGGNAELQYYSPRNISIEKHPATGESCLVLTAKKEDYGNRPCTSARLNTQDKVTVHYGKVEARIAFPHTADGLWPAFWMLGNNLAKNLGNNDDVDKTKAALAKQGRVVWPKCGEIDICEMGHHKGIENGTQDRYFNGACHWGESFNNGAYPNVGGFYTADYPVQGDFHLFTLVWTEDSIAMYLDQDKYPETAPYFQLSLRNKEVNQPGHYFNHPFYLVLNLAVGGFFPNMPAAEKYPERIT
ncbi:MAG: glycoside hydrolase family 16 protein, partial [Paludibacteraceae bacterium]|nr:glycoside hydrolase family 16 protein [Paludibacteraceae bacterium]